METFVLKIYRRDKATDRLVGTLQNINSGQHYIFASQEELSALLLKQVTQTEVYQPSNPGPATPGGDFPT